LKILIASDIHGSSYYCEKLIERIEIENPDKILLLGDLLYHGPRNDLPKDYNPKKVIEYLNKISSKIICVRGNCDAEVDQMVLDFPIMADYVYLCVDGLDIYATHGHIYSEEAPLKLPKKAYMLAGHTHIPGVREHDEFIYMNPGSISIPKENSANSYIMYENKEFTWKSVNTGEKTGLYWKDQM